MDMKKMQVDVKYVPLDGEEILGQKKTTQKNTEEERGRDTMIKKDDANSLSEWWSGAWGDEYLKRNRVDWRARIPFWDRLVAKYGFRSVYEVGCNAGWNLSAIKHSIHGYNVQLRGEDVNQLALIQANSAGLSVYLSDQSPIGDSHYELVYTAGVLIHIAPQDLKAFMQRIVDASCDYVLAIEYEDETEVEVEYRGHAGKLWRRPYGRLYEELGLTLVETGKVGKEDGFDDCVYWLLRK